MSIRLKIILGLLLSLTLPVCAAPIPQIGGSLSLPLITKDPKNLHGYRAAIWYQPEMLVWKHARVFFDASFGRWWVSNNIPYNNLNIYSVSPVLRYYFAPHHYFSPFINLSIGLSYLTRTKLARQKLGMHFAFQDQLGIGASFGAKQQFSLSLSAMHYSNGSLCKHNSGITIPLLINAEYGFA